MAAYYNEIEPTAVAWLKELIKRGLIADGDVDDRSIEDVLPSELLGYTQCHFFAGIGVWSYALRQAGWRDDRPIWTGSCPCQPFSAAGKGKGVADERHLWPAFHHLIRECRPVTVLGEQVANKAGESWFDIVRTDLEAEGYAAGLAVFPACGVGAPHQRKRLYWAASALEDSSEGRAGDRHNSSCEQGRDALGGRPEGLRQGYGETGSNRMHPDGATSGLGNTSGEGHGWSGRSCGEGVRDATERSGEPCGLAESKLRGQQPQQKQLPAGIQRAMDVAGKSGRISCALRPALGSMADASKDGCNKRRGSITKTGSDGTVRDCGFDRPGPTNGHWRDADWLGCRDGKWRPVIPSPVTVADGSSSDLVRCCNSSGGMYFPLEEKAPARVMRLRGYGNAIVAQQAKAFIEAYLETTT